MAATKSSNFHDHEIEQMARSWLIVSNNPTVGAGQKSDTFWDQIQVHFNKSMDNFRRERPGVVSSTFRTMRSLQSKWTDVNHDSAKFSGCFSQIEALNESGKTIEQKVEDAKEMYKKIPPKLEDFKFFGAWEILREAPKWHIASRLQEKHLTKRKRASPPSVASGNATQNSPVELQAGDDDSPSPPADGERRMGNKKAKELDRLERRGQRAKDSIQSEKSEIAQALNRRAKSVEEMNEHALFMTDITGMEPEAQEFLREKRYMARLKLQKDKLEFMKSHQHLVSSLHSQHRSPPCTPLTQAPIDFAAAEDDDSPRNEGHEQPSDAAPTSDSQLPDSQPRNSYFSHVEAADLYRQWV